MGRMIRQYRVLQDLTQWELCNLTGIKQCKLSLFENGLQIPTFEEIKKLAKALDVSLITLLEK